MKQKDNDLFFQRNIFAWIATATGAVLLVPLVAMQFTTDVRWDAADFIVMGCLLFGTGSLFVLAARRAPRRHRAIIGSLLLIAFLFIWSELAVGVFTNIGS